MLLIKFYKSCRIYYFLNEIYIFLFSVPRCFHDAYMLHHTTRISLLHVIMGLRISSKVFKKMTSGSIGKPRMNPLPPSKLEGGTQSAQLRRKLEILNRKLFCQQVISFLYRCNYQSIIYLFFLGEILKAITPQGNPWYRYRTDLVSPLVVQLLCNRRPGYLC